MVRLSDLPEYERDHLLAKNGEPLGPTPFVSLTKPISELRIALITTAGLHFRDDPAFDLADDTYRPIPGEANANELVMSHSSVNFDRTGFQEDVNLVFPIDRFRELEQQGEIAALADIHYSFMGAGHSPEAYEKSSETVAQLLKNDEVDAAFLTPV